MEKEEVKSKWDELARQIGAEVSPDSERIVEAVSSEPQSVESSSPPAERPAERAAPKRPAAGWDNLASEFGLPTPEPEEPPVVEERVVSASKQVVVSPVSDIDAPRGERHGERPPRERQARDKNRSDRHTRERDESERRPSGGRSRGRRSSERDRESGDDRPRRGRRDRAERHDRPRESQRREAEPQFDEEFERHEHVAAGRESAEPREPERVVSPEPPKPAPAVSLWQKIFGAPAEPAKQSEPVAREGDSGDAGAVESMRDSEASRSEVETSYSLSHRDADEADDRSIGELSDEIEPVGGEEQLEQRGRRRRRGRRGRGGRVEKQERAGSADATRHAPARDDFETDDDELDESDDQGADIGRQDSDISSGNGADHGERTGRSRGALQRSIPSWEEAIGYIVDSNLQTRSQRRPSSQSGPQRGRTRGRRNR